MEAAPVDDATMIAKMRIPLVEGNRFESFCRY
jgi:hypothetical protein